MLIRFVSLTFASFLLTIFDSFNINITAIITLILLAKKLNKTFSKSYYYTAADLEFKWMQFYRPKI